MKFEIEDAGPNRYGACHKITIKDVDDSVSKFWYVKAKKDLPDFDQRIHMDPVKQICHLEGTSARTLSIFQFRKS